MYTRTSPGIWMGLTHLVIGVFVFVTACACIIDRLGGDFSRHPSDTQELSQAARDLVAAAYEGIDERGIVDYHVHLLGLGSSGSGASVNPNMRSWAHPIQRFKFAVYKSASGIQDEELGDEQYVDRLVAVAENMGLPGRFHLLALDRHYDAQGLPVEEKTTFYVPNDYVVEVARHYPHLFVPVMSVHPYRADALEELERWAAEGVRMVKWLPNAMGIDPAAPRLDPFYAKMAELGIVLLSHAGYEQAVEAEEDQKLGNPLRLRRALDHGVRVVVAHCASLGEFEDLDDPNGQMVSSFRLFLRLLEDPRYDGLLFGDLSGLTQVNRLSEPLETILRRTDLHRRLVNGSDYPLPAINALIHTGELEDEGYITAAERAALNEIYEINPLLFDFVLRRTVRHPASGNRLPATVFMRNPALPLGVSASESPSHDALNRTWWAPGSRLFYTNRNTTRAASARR